MKILSAGSMREVDRRTIEEIGLPGAVLMETAGLRVVEFIKSHHPPATKVVVAAGPGNNGGDGLVVARLLHRAGYTVSLFSTVKAGSYSNDAAVNEQYLLNTSFPINRLIAPEDLECFKKNIATADLLIDALLGTGVDGPVEGIIAVLITIINASRLPVLSVDIPSGLNADNGFVGSVAVKADWTVTFAYPKQGLFLGQGAAHAGDIFVGDINIPSDLVENEPVELLTQLHVSQQLPKRPLTAHKGSMGKVLIVAGSLGMSGAAAMTAESALKSGAGLVYLAVPQSLYPSLAARLLEVIIIGLPEQEPGIIDSAASSAIIKLAESCDVLAAGPGLDPGEATVELLANLIAGCSLPLVLDAGALEALIGKMHLLQQARQQPVLTPHPGEMSRLIGTDIEHIQENRLNLAIKYADSWNAVLLLKGYNTVIAAPDNRIRINPTGSSILATAGSGDLLTGMIASFIAQGINSFEAAAVGAFCHGLAGDFISSSRGYMARDIMMQYPRVFDYLDQIGACSTDSSLLVKVRPLSQ